MSEEKKKKVNRKKKKENIEQQVSINELLELRSKVEELERRIEKLEEKISDKDDKQEQGVNVKAEERKIDFQNKKVIVKNVNSDSLPVTVIPGDSMQLTTSNVYTFPIEEIMDSIVNMMLVPPFDEIFELVSFDKDSVKLRPRKNVNVKTGTVIVRVFSV